MTLIGHRQISLDAKNRAVMPVNFRAVLPEKLLICPGFQEQSLLIFTEESFEKYAARSKQVMNNDYYAVWKRLTYASLMDICIDDRGRFMLPTVLTEQVPFNKTIYLYGRGNCLALFPEALKVEGNPECVLV